MKIDNKCVMHLLSKVVLLVFICLGLTGCANARVVEQKSDKINIICTAFPQYDWVKSIIAGKEDKFEVSLLNEKGGDIHNYQPSALDIARISECDMFIYVGGESDGWVADALKNKTNNDMCVINIMDIVSEDRELWIEEELEGIEPHEHSHEHEHNHEADHEEADEVDDEVDDDVEYDEHVWLSLVNAQIIVDKLAENLITMDMTDRDIFEANKNKYIAELENLDMQYKALSDSMENPTLLFADRFPFRYMIEDYGIRYYAAFEGCSAETEASFKTIAFLINKINELELKSVMVIDGSDKRLASVISENSEKSDINVLEINSLQAVSKKQIEDGFTYLKAMENNYIALSQAWGD